MKVYIVCDDISTGEILYVFTKEQLDHFLNGYTTEQHGYTVVEKELNQCTLQILPTYILTEKYVDYDIIYVPTTPNSITKNGFGTYLVQAESPDAAISLLRSYRGTS